MACVTACPSGVQYDSLLEAARPQVEREAKRGFGDRAFRRMIFAMFPHPGRLRAVVVAARSLPEARACSGSLHKSGLLALLPQAAAGDGAAAAAHHLRQRHPSRANSRAGAAAASVSGCCSDASSACSSRNVNEATARVLAAEGCEVVIPPAQQCCGALAEHAGEEEDAMAAARRLIDAFERAATSTPS